MTQLTFAFKSNVPTALTLAPTESGGKAAQGSSLSLTVQNATTRRTTGRMSIQPVGATKAEWFSLDGAVPTNPREREMDFDPGATQTVKVLLAVPQDAPAGDYVFKVRAAAVDIDPDNDVAESPAVGFKFTPSAKAAPTPSKPFPWWIVAVVALVVVAGGGATYMFWPKPAPPPVAEVIVPKVHDEALGAGVTALLAAGFVVDGTAITSNPSQPDQWIVSQSPGEGTKLPAKSTVSITVNHRVPIVCGPPALCKWRGVAEFKQSEKAFVTQKDEFLSRVNPAPIRPFINPGTPVRP